MTPLPAFSEQVVERRDLPEYEIEPRCANPRCPNRAEHPHEIRPRSQTAGMVWWVEIPGRFMLGNRVGLCAGCHRKTDDHTAAIIWDEQMAEFAWCDLAPAPDGWAEALDPMPPIHRIMGGLEEFIATNVVENPAPPAPEPEDVKGMEQLGPAMQNMERFLGTGELPEIQPVELPPEQPFVARALPPNEAGEELGHGDDEQTVMRARQVTDWLQKKARDQESLPAPAVPWRADIIVHPDENRVEVLTGDLRVGTFLEETIAKAKRAPKPREPKPVIPDDGTREPAKARRTYSISVPADERDGEKVAAGEDGYALLEEALDNLRQRFGRDDFPGWRYYVLIEALHWALLNYSDEGED